MTQDTQVEVDLNGRHFVLIVSSEQLNARGPGDLITAEIIDVAPAV